jgi:hypothetical protein
MLIKDCLQECNRNAKAQVLLLQKEMCSLFMLKYAVRNAIEHARAQGDKIVLLQREMPA